MSNRSDARTDFDACGAAVFADVVGRNTCDHILPEIDGISAGARLANPSQLIRHLISATGAMGQLAMTLAGPAARPVRILAFDKTPERNWKLGWHQDRVIAVKEQAEHPGYTNWTLKAGIPHVEPPQEVLKQMFSLRLHLDDCGPENGALKIIPGSWHRGRVEKPELLGSIDPEDIRICPAQRGDVLAMRALTFHASDAADNPTRRRVLHIDYATCDLPGDLEWFLDPSPKNTT